MCSMHLEQIVGAVPEVLSAKLIHLRGAIHFSAPLSGPAHYSLKDAMENYYSVVYLQEHKKK